MPNKNTVVDIETRVLDRANKEFCYLETEGKSISINDNIVDDIGADSLDVIEFTMAIEEEFEIDIPDIDAEKLLTLKDYVEYVDKNFQIH